jgi:hypothetical protein
MGRKFSKREKLDLLTTDLNFKMLVGETVFRFFFVKELHIEEEPARRRGQPFPLGDVTARASLLEAGVDGNDRIKLRGKVGGKAVFYSELGPREVAWEEEEFVREVDYPGALPGMEVNGYGRISFLEEEGPPLELEGKLIYRLNFEVEVLLSLAETLQVEVAVGAKDISPEKIERAALVTEELLQEKSFSVTLSKELEFGQEPLYLKTLTSYIKDFSWDWQKEGITLQGELVTVAYFLTEKEQGFRETRQQFNQQLVLTRLSKDARVFLFPHTAYVVHDFLGKRARQRISLDVYVRVTRGVQQEILSDIQEQAVKKELLALPNLLGTTRESLELVERLNFSYPGEITAGPSRLLSLALEMCEDSVAVTGKLEKKIYYLPGSGMEAEGEDAREREGPLSLKVEEDFYRTLYLPGIDPQTARGVVSFHLEGTEFAPAEGATLLVSHGLLEVKAWEMQEYSVVIPYRIPPGTSMVVYNVKPGESLLKIARSYGVKPSVILEANSLKEESFLEAGQKLLIPLMFYSDS